MNPQNSETVITDQNMQYDSNIVLEKDHQAAVDPHVVQIVDRINNNEFYQSEEEDEEEANEQPQP